MDHYTVKKFYKKGIEKISRSARAYVYLVLTVLFMSIYVYLVLGQA